MSDGEEEELDVGFSGGRDDFEDEVPFDEDEDDGLNDGDSKSPILVFFMMKCHLKRADKTILYITCKFK